VVRELGENRVTLLRKQKAALLVLEDGSVFRGEVFAGGGEVLGEVVFNTGMTGYQEILTDPSYKGQIVTMTYPLIGNYGINPRDMESAGICLEGLIVREYSDFPSNWQSSQTLKSFLESEGKLGVEGLDCRALTRRLRVYGAMRGVLSSETSDIEHLLQKVRAYPGLVGRDLVRTVGCRQPYRWVRGCAEKADPDRLAEQVEHLRVVVLDCGVKYNILRCLEEVGCEVVVVPAGSSSTEILSWSPDGLLLSNGPGDPAALPHIVATVRELLGKLPIFGICLGHQILGQAVGARTEKMKFGHHGINQPVRQKRTGRVEITSQNHGFVVLPESLPSELEQTHENLNDGTSEGIAYPSLRASSVQYHPEAAPGPQDAFYLFKSFIETMSSEKKHAPRKPS